MAEWKDNEGVAQNTDRELWRGPDDGRGSFYADSIHVTVSGAIGIDCGGTVIVMPLRKWHELAMIYTAECAASSPAPSQKEQG